MSNASRSAISELVERFDVDPQGHMVLSSEAEKFLSTKLAELVALRDTTALALGVYELAVLVDFLKTRGDVRAADSLVRVLNGIELPNDLELPEAPEDSQIDSTLEKLGAKARAIPAAHDEPRTGLRPWEMRKESQN